MSGFRRDQGLLHHLPVADLAHFGVLGRDTGPELPVGRTGDAAAAVAVGRDGGDALPERREPALLDGERVFDERDHVAARPVESGVARDVHVPLVDLDEHVHVVPVADHPAGPVGRGAVDDDHLGVRRPLGQRQGVERREDRHAVRERERVVAANADGGSQPPSPGAEQAVERLSDRLVDILNDATKDTAARERALAEALGAALDFDTLAPFVLGRYTADLTAEQRRTFRRTFSDYVVETYARLLARNAIAEMEVIQSRRVTTDTAAVATRVARRQGEASRWIWRLHRRNAGGWAVVDLQTPTASLAVNYRSEFGHVLHQRGFDALIQEINSHTERDAILPAENRAILMLIRGMQANKLALTAQ